MLVMAVLLLTFPVSAEAVDLRFPDGQRAEPYQQWADRAQAPMPPATVTVYDYACDAGVRYSCAMPDPLRIWIGERTSRALYHELGHIFDYTVMSDAARQAFLTITNDSRPWRSPPNSPHEQFAEAYRLCARYGGRLPVNGEVKFDYTVTPRQHWRVCAMIRRQAARYADS